MPKRKTTNSLTVRELRELEKAAAEGDTKAQEELNSLEEYRELKEHLNKLSESFSLESSFPKGLEELKKAISELAGPGTISEYLKNVFEQNKPTFDENSKKNFSLKILGNDNPVFNIPYTPPPEQRIERELIETNRLLKEQNQFLMTVLASEVITSQSKARQLDIEVPKQPGPLKRWKVVWKYTKVMWDKGTSIKDIVDWLRKTHPTVACGTDTLRKILIAGESGALD